MLNINRKKYFKMYEFKADCEVVEISNVLRPGKDQGITIVIDTEDDTFRFIPELITIDNAPLWLYNAAHGTNVRGCEARV